MNIPKTIIAGNAVTWYEDLTGEATSTYKIVMTKGQSPVTIQAASVADSKINFTLSSQTSASIPAGTYDVYLFEVYANGDRYYKDATVITVLPDPAATADNRSHVKRTLDLIETAIENQADAGIASKTVDGISLSFCSSEKLFELREKYAYLYACERNGGNPPLPQSATLTWRR